VRAGLFQSLTARFRNGIPVNAVSRRAQRVLSINDQIWDIIDTRVGTLSHLQLYGIPDVLPDTVGAVPKTESKLVADHLKKYLPVFIPNIKNVYDVHWEVNPKGCFCECILICVLNDRAVLRYFVQFPGFGANKIKPIRGGA
jgi:hypothetical protein